MQLGVQRERQASERRVAVVPRDVTAFIAAGFDVVVEEGSGLGAGFPDDAYRGRGASITSGASVAASDLVVGVRGTSSNTLEVSPVRATVGIAVALFDPLWRPFDVVEPARHSRGIIALELVPRITRAQSMDVLSSMATVAGYEAALLGAQRLSKMFPLMMTAAGTLAPAKVLVIGAGVAGLQAIAMCRRLGAIAEAYDIRPGVAEQIRSVGGRPIAFDLEVSSAEDEDGYAVDAGAETLTTQQEHLRAHVASADVVITTAAVPGGASPLLISAAAVTSMSTGSVIVDLAAERGGNCALTKPDEEIMVDGVLVLGPTDLASKSASHASEMFSRNVLELVLHHVEDGEITLDVTDEITSTMLVALGGEIVHPAVREALDA
ncbi:MAG: NAD(P) transhydrogenase subunit alpha [Actinomycetota bacterium]|nr:NAD(P) transhydrogenase subunit alpha [Actinomycetota bacterium]